MTNSWTDIKNTDLVVIMGGNAAEAHPCGFKWVTEAKHHRGAKLIVVDPRFNRSASVADYYAPIRPGSDIAFLMGVIRWCIENDKVQWDYVRNYTNVSYLVREDFGWQDGMFTGYDEAKREYDQTSWEYQIGEDGYVLTDETLQNPRTVWQLLKKHVEIYTPEFVENVCGTPKDRFLKICEMIGECSSPTKTMTSMYALGWTQHSKGSQNIRGMAMLQLLLGNIGVPGGGMNALRGHSNIQGLTDVGLMSNLIPGYLAMPKDSEPDFETYMSTRANKPLRPNQMSYWQNYRKFFVSFLKTLWGDKATATNGWGYDWLPKLDIREYDGLRMFDMMSKGEVNLYFCQGFNPILAFPNRGKLTEAFSKLKMLVVMDPLQTETASFWENHGIYNDVDTASIKTEVLELPTTCFAEDEGATVSSGRWLQWHWAGVTPPGEAQTDTWIMANIYLRVKALYEKEGGKAPEPIMNLSWDYKEAHEPTAAELAQELNGRALETVYDPADPSKKLQEKGKLLSGFGQLRDDGTTTSACWIYTGCFTEAGNNMARRDNSDPSGMGVYQNWSFSWPANRRILYNRASCDLDGKPWDPARSIVHWDGSKWTGADVPDIALTAKPREVGPFIMNPEGTSRFFSRKLMRDGPFPTHMEPFESPVANPLNPSMRGNPAARIFEGDVAQLGDSKEFPFVATSYRLTEHFHYWTKHNRVNAVNQPEFFVEISEELAAERGIIKGSRVRVWSKRGQVWAKAVVTKRIRPLVCDGKTVHVIGIPLHWGFKGAARKGFGPNTLGPFVGDANIDTPEFKAYLVNIEPASEGTA
ncbi:formate dehydrogenase (quinone-dependent) catalytic subunit [Paracandidimonas soli]|uniref:Formate dehydrogenase (Quinone-dependent) catalytic subunit n=2 Tax=Paracandidimonas soli TaxID=1917182 RepID=A0A4R3VGU0_9BURK|nr:formate dehydrogenase (quinone-dependent) catalytic subunit [Paracandidimonas soli]